MDGSQPGSWNSLKSFDASSGMDILPTSRAGRDKDQNTRRNLNVLHLCDPITQIVGHLINTEGHRDYFNWHGSEQRRHATGTHYSSG